MCVKLQTSIVYDFVDDFKIKFEILQNHTQQ